MDVKNILLTTDFSDHARRAYGAAAGLARRTGAKVHLVHVTESPAHFYFQTEGFGVGGTHKDFVTSLQQHLSEERGNPALDGVEVETHLISDDHLISGLKRYENEHDIDFAVISSHGRSGLSYAVLGSSAEKIVRGLACPVLTYRSHTGRGDFDPRKILVPYDFSENAEIVLPTVRALARTFAPAFTFTFVVEPIYPFFSETAHSAYHFIGRSMEESVASAERKFGELREDELAGVNASIQVIEGIPTGEVISQAESGGYDLVIMATHGWTGFRHFFLGSVAETVVRKAPCSVLTVRSLTDD